MKKTISFIMCLLILTAVGSCGSKESTLTEPPTQAISTESESISEEIVTTTSTITSTVPETTTSADFSEIEAFGDIDVDSGLFNVTITFPADFVGETTQEQIDESVKEKGYKSGTLNSDGSVTYIITKKQHKEWIDETKKTINDALSEMVGSETYPNITSAEANEDFTVFTIKTTNTELSFSEALSVMAFYAYGGMYAIVCGESVDNIHVDFINSTTGELVESADSSNLKSE